MLVLNESSDDVWDNLINEVQRAYFETLKKLPTESLAPDLVEVYYVFVENIVDNIYDTYEEVFGIADYLREDWLNDLGIDRSNIPGILSVCRVLNILHLPYTYKSRTYGFIQNHLLNL